MISKISKIMGNASEIGSADQEGACPPPEPCLLVVHSKKVATRYVSVYKRPS